MTDFLTFLYASYINPYLQAQPKDDGDQSRFSLWECGCTREQREDAAAVIRFYAVHAFLLGLRTGAGLSRSGGL